MAYPVAMATNFDPAPVPRKRGAPLGNQNARKHGFYSKALSPEEQEVHQEAIDLKDLKSEIALLRVKVVRMVSNPDTPEELILQAIRTLTRLVDLQYKLTYK